MLYNTTLSYLINNYYEYNTYIALLITVITYFLCVYRLTYDPFLLKLFTKKKKISTIYDSLNKYIKHFSIYYDDRDESHGIEHVSNVAILANEIADHYELNPLDKKIITITSLLHDAYDHKYVKNPEKLKRRINRDLRKLYCTDAQIILIHNIIEDISFSKEKKKRDPKYPTKKIITFDNSHNQLLRDIISDADKCEAIGDSAIVRMIQYMNHNNKYNEYDKYSDEWYKYYIKHIKEHCDEKLFILLSHNYIRTSKGRKLAKEKEDYLRKVINNEKLLKKLIKDFS